MTPARRPSRRAVLLVVAMALAFAGAFGALLRDDTSPVPSQRAALPERDGHRQAPWSEPQGAARTLPASEAPPPTGAGEPTLGDAALSSGADGPTRRVAVSGRLVLEGADGAPAPREVVAGWASGSGEVTAEVAPDGTFALELEPSRVAQGRHTDDLMVMAAETRGWSCPRERVAPGQREIVVVAIRAAAALRGTVLDPAGQPVSGASVWLGAFAGAVRSTVTNAAGTFAIDELPPDLYDLEVRAGGLRGERRGLAVYGSETEAALTLNASRTLAVTLRTSDGAAVAGRVVVRSETATRIEATAAPGAPAAFSDLPAGPLVVTALAPELALWARATVHDESELDLRLEPAARLEGRVSTSPGVRPRQVVVRATDTAGGVSTTLKLDDAGRFALVVAPGRVDVAAFRSNNQPLARATDVEGRPGVTTRVELATSGAVLRVRIVPPPVGGMVAVSTPSGEPLGGAAVGPDGQVELTDLLPGPARIAFSSELDQAIGVATTHLTAGTVAEVLVERRRAARARVRLVDARGRPLRGGALCAEGPGAAAGATTDHVGEATLGGLTSGRWTFGVRDDALPRLAARLGVPRLVVAPVEVQVEGEREVEVVLRALEP